MRSRAEALAACRGQGGGALSASPGLGCTLIVTESQRAMMAASLANLGNGQKASSANLQSTPITQPQAADMLQVSPRSVGGIPPGGTSGGMC